MIRFAAIIEGAEGLVDAAKPDDDRRREPMGDRGGAKPLL
jgi:hypothetical protein